MALTLKKQRSTIEAEISAPKPPVTGASWLICTQGIYGSPIISPIRLDV